jgi:hypothetical protein
MVADCGTSTGAGLRTGSSPDVVLWAAICWGGKKGKEAAAELGVGCMPFPIDLLGVGEPALLLLVGNKADDLPLI